MDEPAQLTAFQADLTRTFFSLAESEGFLLAGGAALAAQSLTTRPTRDLDFFTGVSGTVLPALEALEDAAAAHGWTVERRQVGDTFCRITVHGPDDVDVDLALDASPGMEPSMTVLGPTFAPEELAARKLLALFGRGYPRDFADVYVLAQRFGTETMLARAQEADPGFDLQVLAEMIGGLGHYADDDLPIDNPADVRAFFSQWRAELTAMPTSRAEPPGVAPQVAGPHTPARSYYAQPPTNPPPQMSL